MLYSLVAIILISYFFFKRKKNKQSIQSICCICEQVFPEYEIRNVSELTFCQEHFTLYRESEWELVKTVKASSENSQSAMDIYELKQKFFQKGRACYIQTSYQEEDTIIISIFKLYCIKK